jgi:hypothetical protein
MSAEKHDMSTFALDVHFASGKPADLAIEEHLAECDTCSAYLRSLEELAVDDVVAESPTSESPASRVSSLRVVDPKPLRRAAMVGGAVLLAASFALFLRTEGTKRNGDYVGVKGAPAVQVLVRRGATTSIWDGRAAMHSGDAIALRVACEGLQQAAVLSPNGKEWQRLSDAPCPSSAEPLPFTLVVDDQPGDEKLAVVLSDAALDDQSLRKAIADNRRAADVWVTSFVFSKETSAP